VRFYRLMGHRVYVLDGVVNGMATCALAGVSDRREADLTSVTVNEKWATVVKRKWRGVS